MEMWLAVNLHPRLVAAILCETKSTVKRKADQLVSELPPDFRFFFKRSPPPPRLTMITGRKKIVKEDRFPERHFRDCVFFLLARDHPASETNRIRELTWLTVTAAASATADGFRDRLRSWLPITTRFNEGILPRLTPWRS
uniref:Putative secreted protein n=1 Tax=Anopheles triannulatus TaxID=58253 RepID=A0A2M4B273_9DIPT